MFSSIPQRCRTVSPGNGALEGNDSLVEDLGEKWGRDCLRETESPVLYLV